MFPALYDGTPLKVAALSRRFCRPLLHRRDHFTKISQVSFEHVSGSLWDHPLDLAQTDCAGRARLRPRPDHGQSLDRRLDAHSAGRRRSRNQYAALLPVRRWVLGPENPLPRRCGIPRPPDREDGSWPGVQVRISSNILIIDILHAMHFSFVSYRN
jgi:hypothetical protein